MQKKTKIIYWIFTGLLILSLGPGAVMGAMNLPDGAAVFVQLGYPTYLVPFIGVAKALALIAILIPGYPRIKEWAYAGLAYDLIAAMYSQIRMNEAGWPIMLVFIAVLAGSYVYYHKLENEKAVVSI